MNTYELAKDLVKDGLSVVPVAHRTKRPTLEWKSFQSRHPSVYEIRDWFLHQDVGLGVVCGPISGHLVCLDFDTPGSFEAFAKFPANQELLRRAPIAKTSRGHHVFLRTEWPIKSKALYIEGIEGKAGDLLSEGKFVVLPPTIHPDGTVREWVRPMTDGIPLIDYRTLNLGTPPRRDGAAEGMFTEGERHTRLLSEGGKFRQEGYEYSDLYAKIMQVNRACCSPRLPDLEIAQIAMFLASKPVSSFVHAPSATGFCDEANSNSSFITNTTSIEEDSKGGWTFSSLFVDGKTYMQEREDEQIEWLIEDLLPLSFLVVVGATSKCGKSCFLTNMVDAVTHGTPFLGKKTLQSPVLWIACEESKFERKLVLKHYPDVSTDLFTTHEYIALDSADGIEKLRVGVRESGAKLIVVDPLYGAIDMPSMSKGVEGRSSLKDLKELCRVENVVAIVLHHTNKNVNVGMTRERFADSGQILAVASADWLIDGRTCPDGTRELKMTTTGRGSFANRRLLIHSPSLTEYELVAEGTGDDVFTEMKLDVMVRELQKHHDGQTAYQLSETLKQPIGSIRNRLTQLVREKHVIVLRKLGKSSVYAASQTELVEAA